MKSKKLLVFFFLLIGIAGFSQTKDSTLKSSWYARALPLGLSTTAGPLSTRTIQNIEVGKSIGVFDLGLAYGKLSQKTDTTDFLEAKITMDACQYGIFSNEFTIGGGKVFNSAAPYLFEVSSTIFAQIGKNWGAGLVAGNYYTTGNYYSTSNQYFGIFLRYGLLRSMEGALVHPGHHHGR